MALNPFLAVKTAAKSKHTTFSGALGDFKARLVRVAVNLQNGTGNRAFFKASHRIFPSNSAFFTCHVLSVCAKEEDSSVNVVPGTATLQNVYFEPEGGIVTTRNFSTTLQTFTAKEQIYCDNLRKFTSKVYFFPATLQLYSDKVQTFTVKVRIVGAKVQNDTATVKNEENRWYPLSSMRQPFTFCNQMVCAIPYPSSCSFKPSMYNDKF